MEVAMIHCSKLLPVMLMLAQSLLSQEASKPTGIQTNDQYYTFTPNNLSIVLSNNGAKSNSRATGGGPGLEWPVGSGKYVGFHLGTIWTGLVERLLHTGGSPFHAGLQAGTIKSDGKASDPSDPRFRIYHIKRGDTTSIDYIQWPAKDGAPTNKAGRPLLFGDEQVWYVMNDLDFNRTMNVESTAPIGIECHVLAWGVRNGLLNDVLFFREKLINKSDKEVEFFRRGLYVDFDIGEIDNDMASIDTGLGILYTYNATTRDSVYSISPAAGLLLLNPYIVNACVIDLRSYISTSWPSIVHAKFLHMLQGLYRDGYPIVNPLTSQNTLYSFSGNPLTGEGWLMAKGDEVRSVLSVSPKSFKPNDTLELEYAIIVGQASDNIQSVKKVQHIAKVIRTIYGITTTTVGNQAEVPNTIHLESPYPNPIQLGSAIPVTIRYGTPESTTLRLELYDNLGRLVERLAENDVHAGMQSLNYFPNESFTTGVYHLVLRTYNQVSRRPLIITRF